MSCHVSACPNHQTKRTLSLNTRGVVASLGPFGYELDLTKLTQEEKTAVKEQIAEYKKISDLVLKGDLFRLLNPYECNHFCEMIVSKDKSYAYLAGVRVLSYPNYHEHLRLDGLADEKIYRIEELGVETSGASLKYAGILLPKPQEDFGAWVWHIREIK